jgi:hypothetical protein
MANEFGFLADSTFAEKMDVLNTYMAAILEAQGGSLIPTSWDGVSGVVKSGLASKVFSVRDQLVTQRNGVNLIWDILGFDVDTPADPQYQHSMTLGLHDCIASLQYDAPEAFYYCEEELPAGTYYLTFGSSWGKVVSGKSYQFTLTQAVPAKGQLVGFSDIYNFTGTTKVTSYASSTSTTAIETVTCTEGSSGTFLGTFKLAADGNLNSLQRAAYGSGNYKESAIRQYLNSEKAAGAVWVPQTKFDRPPSWASNTAGFLNGMDEDFLVVVGTASKVVSRDTITDGGGSDTVKDKFFLLSRREVYMGNEQSTVIEGEPYPYYANYSDNASASTGNDSNRIKYYSNGNAGWWWLRTPNAGSGYYVRDVGTTGYLHYYGAYHSCGVAPACIIV